MITRTILLVVALAPSGIALAAPWSRNGHCAAAAEARAREESAFERHVQDHLMSLERQWAGTHPVDRRILLAQEERSLRAGRAYAQSVLMR